MRVLESYYEAKCRRMKRIKSKKYRKIRKKVRLAHGLSCLRPFARPRCSCVMSLFLDST